MHKWFVQGIKVAEKNLQKVTRELKLHKRSLVLRSLLEDSDKSCPL